MSKIGENKILALKFNYYLMDAYKKSRLSIREDPELYSD